MATVKDWEIILSWEVMCQVHWTNVTTWRAPQKRDCISYIILIVCQGQEVLAHTNKHWRIQERLSMQTHLFREGDVYLSSYWHAGNGCHLQPGDPLLAIELDFTCIPRIYVSFIPDPSPLNIEHCF